MPKLKRDDVADLDIEALDAAEYDDSEFESYDGEVPPVGTELRGFLKSMWWTRSAEKPDGTGDNPMIKALWVAAENDGDEEEYNGCPFWMNLPLIESVKFRWAPFMAAFGMSIRDFKGGSKVYVTGEETQNGAPIERVANFRPGEESDDAWCRIVSGREPYQGEWQARVKEWLPWEDVEDGGPEDGEPEDLYNDDGDLVNEDGHLINEDGDLINEDGELVDEDDNVIEDGEPEPEPEPPARGARTRSGTTSRSRSAQKPAAASSGRSRTPARSAPARPAAATSARSGRSSTRSAPARSAPKAGTKPAGRGRGRPADDDPPF